MKRFHIIFAVICQIVPMIALAQTTVPSGTVNGTWNVSGSPYLIQGDITVPQASTLQIDPGVVVEFQGHYKFNISGSLKAIGTSTDSIRFVVPTALISTGWFGLRFNSILASQDSSILKYSIVRYGKANGINANGDGGGIYIYNSPKVRVTNCFVSNNQANGNGGGVYFTLCSPIIAYNSIKSNTCTVSGGGICGLSGTSSTIAYNNISFNSSAGTGGGIHCGPSTTIKVSYNSIKNNSAANGGGISLGSSANVTINNDTILNNYASGPGGGIYADNSNSGIFSNNVIGYNNSNNNGGGISCGTFNTTQITNNTINNNHSSGSGGGIIIGANSIINIQDNTIENNTANGSAGGIYITSASSSAGGFVNGNIINNNSAVGFGGGIFAHFASQFINNNTITNNTANSGGGIYLDEGSWNHVIKGNTISGNVTVNQGGGIYAEHDDAATIAENIITNNTGGIYLTSPFGHGITYNFTTYIKQNFITNNYKYGGITLNVAGAEIKSNVICNNSNDFGGGGISAINSTFYVLNCTISNNKSNNLSEGGGGIYCSQTTSTKFINCIINGNSAPSGNGGQVFLKDSNSDPLFQFCNVENGMAGFYTNGYQYTGNYTNNIDTITHFIAPSGGSGNTFNGLAANWRLKVISPCLNNGSGMYYLAADKDVVGNNRKIDIGIDRGAFEFDSCFLATINPLVTVSGSSLTSAQSGASSYTWLDCNDNYSPLPSTGSLQTIMVQTGNYAVEINRFGCIDTSACVSVVITGIDENKLNSNVQIFPNPVSNQLLILNDQFVINEVVIFDLTGKKIKQFAKTSNEIDVSDLPAGVYFIKLSNKEEIITRKFIKERSL